MKKFIYIHTIFFLLFTVQGYSTEQIVDFDKKSIPVLNNELDDIRKEIKNIKEIRDSDNDTKIQVEESADEDTIRFDAAGTEMATINSSGLTLSSGADVNEFSTDGTMAGNSDDAVPTEKAVKTYVDAGGNIKIGTFTRDTSAASGTQAVTGVGFQPSTVLFIAIEDGTDEASWGIDDGTTAKGFGDDAGTSYNTISAVDSIVDLQSGAGTSYTGRISSLDSNGFTISWTKTGSPSGTLIIYYLALK